MTMERRGRRPYGRLAVVLVMMALGLSGADALLDPRPAAAMVADGAIVASHSDLCLAVDGGSLAAGAAVVQQPCDGSSPQRWTTTDLGGGYWRIQSDHSGLCLDVEGGSTANLARLILWTCHTGFHQQFSIPDGQPSRIVARHSGSCIDVEGGSTAAGAALIQFGCHGGPNQRFTFDAGAGADPSQVGRWSSPDTLPLVPVAASTLDNGKVLMWSAYERFTFGGDRGYTQTALYDLATGSVSERRVANTGHDMFCPGIANLADGRILVNGGSSSAETSIYDPASDAWIDAADMNIPRGYQGTTLLSDGSALTLGGSWSGGQGNKHAEIWTPGEGWRRLPGVRAEPFTADDPQGVYRGDNHLWLFAWSGDRVFHAGPTREMHWIDVTGDGSVSTAGDRGSDPYAMNGNAVMFEPGRILTIGGAAAYQNALATTNATVIDLTGPTVTTTDVAAMSFRRAFHSSVVLPSGEVLVIGGQEVPVPFSDDRAILAAELWDPDTRTFRTVAPMAIPRTYHSFALLLPDGRVMAGGGGLCGSCDTNHPDVEIYSPPYLFEADGSAAVRPAITAGPDSIDLGERVEISTSAPITDLVLVRNSSATHAVNNDQRRIPVAFTQTGATTYQVTAPADPGIAVPGRYMLFALDADGTPSEAWMTTITTDVAPPPDDPTSITGRVTDEGGGAVGGIAVDLFTAGPDGTRGTYLATATTGPDGTYTLDVDPGCYVLTFIAPTGRTFTNNSPWYQAPACAQTGQPTTNIDATLTTPTGDSTSINGQVTDTAGNGQAGVFVDLFTANGDGSRGQYQATATTGPDGTYTLDVDPGCYVLTFIAPTGRTFTNNSPWYQAPACAQTGQPTTNIDATLTTPTGDSTSINGQVTDTAGNGQAGVFVDLFTANGDGSRGQYQATATTGPDGTYTLDVDPGCYVLTFIAPTGRTFTNNSPWYQAPACAQTGQPTTNIDATLS